MGWFWNRPTRRERQLAEDVAALSTEVHALKRDVLDLDANVARWMKRDRTRASRETPPVTMVIPGNGGNGHAPSPPPGLRGARLRIWRRQHGLPPLRMDDVQGALTLDESTSQETEDN